METPVRYTGRVKFFNSSKGYGFIVPDVPMENGQAEVFVHHTSITAHTGNFRSLREDEPVEYELMVVNNGHQAANVTGPNKAPVKGDNRARPRTNNFRNPANRYYQQPMYGAYYPYGQQYGANFNPNYRPRPNFNPGNPPMGFDNGFIADQ